MVKAMIRFACACGKRLATSAKNAGRRAECPRCGEPLTIPKLGRPGSAPPVAVSREPAGPCKHPTLDSFYRVLLDQFADSIDRHEVVDGAPALRFLIPEERRQEIRLDLWQDQQGRDWLVMRSEIGTVTTFDETATALKLNQSMVSGRLYLDDFQVLQLEHRSRLDEVDEKAVVEIVRELASSADEFESVLFGIDVR